MTSPTLDVTILGTGTSTGIPVPGCDCAVCTSGIPENSRTRCSVLLATGNRNILIDTTPDLRLQALRENIRHVDAVLYTHTHADHIHGIDDLRPFNILSGGPLPVYASADAIAAMHRNFNYIFGEGEDPGYRPRLVSWTLGGPFGLFGLTIVPIPLVHGPGFSTGYRVGPFAYLTDCSDIPGSSLRLLEDLDVLVIDALRFRPHGSHFNVAQAIAMAERIGARQTLLTHLSHEIDHPRHNPELPAGIEFACDGQQLHFTLANRDLNALATVAVSQ